MAAACGGDADMGGDPAPADTAAGGTMSADPAGTTGDATAELRDAAGNTVGTARFAAAGDGVSVSLEVTGLPPGAHGVHIHETGECDASGETPFGSAGGHLNPTSRQHGLENANGPHAGDLPNLDVGSDGIGSLDGTAAQGAADALALLLDPEGAAIIVHANRDDQVTDDGPDGPGNSGARIACGVISR
jgi:Cu-Zn family superoxide dismutase